MGKTWDLFKKIRDTKGTALVYLLVNLETNVSRFFTILKEYSMLIIYMCVFVITHLKLIKTRWKDIIITTIVRDEVEAWSD